MTISGRRPGLHTLTLAVAVAVAMLVACTSDAEATGRETDSPRYSVTTTTLSPSAFADALRIRDLNALVATFAEDIELYSPLLAEPLVGRDRVTRVFSILLTDVYDDLEIVDELEDPGSYVVSYDAVIAAPEGNQSIHLVDVLMFDDQGRVETLTVTGRPLAGTQALASALAPYLAEIG